VSALAVAAGIPAVAAPIFGASNGTVQASDSSTVPVLIIIVGSLSVAVAGLVGKVVPRLRILIRSRVYSRLKISFPVWHLAEVLALDWRPLRVTLPAILPRLGRPDQFARGLGRTPRAGGGRASSRRASRRTPPGCRPGNRAPGWPAVPTFDKREPMYAPYSSNRG
jgi:hypothetical protein